jgi:hypothetical protein
MLPPGPSGNYPIKPIFSDRCNSLTTSHNLCYYCKLEEIRALFRGEMHLAIGTEALDELVISLVYDPFVERLNLFPRSSLANAFKVDTYAEIVIGNS